MDPSLHFKWLISTYFSDPEKHLSLGPGEILIRQGMSNDRLYLVREGRARAYTRNNKGQTEEIFTAEADDFLGVYSFFSKSYISTVTVEAVTGCELSYIDCSQKVLPHAHLNSLEEQFMPVVVTDLIRRQHRVQELAGEKQQALEALVESEKFTSLGQMAAGIAHELNNAIAVLSRNTNWLVDELGQQWKDPVSSAIFEAGLLHGRFLSSRDVRERRKLLAREFRLSIHAADLLAQTGLTGHQLKTFSTDLEKDAPEIHRIWEIGATFSDMMVAAQQSAHVVQSMKLFGMQSSERTPGLDINVSIENALALLKHRLKMVDVRRELNPVSAITANMGELVQVWTNLLNNACEAVPKEGGCIRIRTLQEAGHIIVRIEDNGSGIPDTLIDKIFQPNVTTKIDGLSFGLGLGLPTVKRIISGYNGHIDVSSSASGTQFNITLPLGGNRG